MKRCSVKIALAVLAFSLGVAAVWCAWRLDESTSKAMSESTPLVTPPIMVYENPCEYPFSGSPVVDEEEAIYLAECFVEENGYTDRPPSTDKSKIVPENIWPMTDEEGMKFRRDSLERHAYSIFPVGREGDWEVVFRYRPHPEAVELYGEGINDRGRAVVVDPSNNRIFIRHSDYPLMIPGARRVDDR